MRVGIVGGGISGLAAALELTREGHHVALFEAESTVGGLIATFDLAGTRIERYYHFLCGGDQGYLDLCKDLALSDRIRFKRSRTGFYYEGVQYPFSTALDLLRFTPIPLSQRVRFGLFALEARMRQEWRQLDELTAKPWLIDRIGLQAYKVIWEPQLSLKFGDLHDQISAAWVWHRLHRVARSKGRLGFLEGGTGLLIDTLDAQIRQQGGAIHTDRRVEAILTKDDAVRGLKLADGETYECDHVVSTLPLSALADLLGPTHQAYQQRLRRVKYIGVVCAVFKLARPVTRCFWLNVHDDRIPFNGIIEYTNLNPIDKAAGHIVYVPYYVPTDHPLYTASDQVVIEKSWSALSLIGQALHDGDIVAQGVFRAPYAQAVCPTGFLDVVPDSQAPIRGLHLLDSTFLYPEDRTQSGLILHARTCARKIPKK